MGNFLSWLARCFGRTPFIEEHEQAMRRSWTLAATGLNLVYSTGSTLYDDKVTGKLDGFRIAICNEFDFAVQKLVTVIRVFSDGVLPASQNLDQTELLAAYDGSAKKSGALLEASLTGEARAWFLGHRYGIGTEVIEGDLLFRQLYGMDNAEHIILVARAMVLTIRQLVNADFRRGEID
jgi:hypothetical protein